MENKMKQNKNSSVVLRVASATLAAVFLFCSLSIPSFADYATDITVPFFADYSADMNSAYSAGLFISQSDSYGYSIITSSSAPVYLLCYRSSDNIKCFCASTALQDSNNGSQYVLQKYTSGGNAFLNIQRSITGTDSATGLYTSTDFLTLSSSYTWNDNFYIGTSRDDALAHLSQALESSGGGLVNPVSLTKDVPAGNALYIQIPTNATVSISCTMTSEVAHPQSWITNQYWGTASGYPSSISGNPSGSTPISWNGYGDKTIFNRYKSFYWNGTVSSSDGYIFIVNPYASIDEYDQSFNPTIYVTVDQAKGYKYYQLTGGISSNGTIGQQSDGTTASGEYDSSTGQWTSVNDSTGLPWTPSEGGGNLITTNSINDWLRTIATQISNFFQGAIGAVTTLVSAGSAFINQLISLYSWLPAPVYAVLSSALIIVITIGVIKVFV